MTEQKLKIHKMKLSEPWYSFVQFNTKTMETRLYDEKRKLLNIGDKIVFTNEFGKYSFTKTIKDLKIFKSFELALRWGKLKNILPGTRTYEDGVKLYHSISLYKENEYKLGVLLIMFN